MNIFLTMDYELFFGEVSGSAKKCLIEPTEKILSISKKHNVGITYFVDAGYLLRLEHYMLEYSGLKSTYNEIVKQLKELLKKGNDIQLHIHPHWESAVFDGENWQMNIDGNYKLIDFEDYQIFKIVNKYKNGLERIIEREVNTCRAGGMSIQPFYRIKNAYKKNGIKYDSSVFPGGAFESDNYNFNYLTAPKKGRYSFEDDVCVEEENGRFTEIPIAGWKYHPMFYLKQNISKKINPKWHTKFGDGKTIPQKKMKHQHFRISNWNTVNCDGFFAQKLPQITKHYAQKKRTDLVIIGQSKSATYYSLEKLDKFIGTFKANHSFLTFKEL